MSYKPAFDSSTLHYAQKALKWLAGEDDQIDIAHLNSALIDLNVWKDNPASPEFDNLIRKVSELEGYRKNQIFGSWDSPKEESLNHDGTNLLRYLFGLLCLSQVIEAMCLADKVYYLGSTGASGFTLSDFASKLMIDKRIWHTISATQEEKEEYAKWIYGGSIATDKNLQAKISSFANLALIRPFGVLSGHLYDTSAGNITPWTDDAYIPTSNFPSFLSWEELEKLITPSPISPNRRYLSSIQRMYKYLINGINYAYICGKKKIDYVPNVVRSPFLFALQYITPSTSKDDLDKILLTLTEAREKKIQSDIPIQVERRIDLSHAMMAAVLSEAKSVKDIMPAVLRVRKNLYGLRKAIKTEGLNNQIIDDIKNSIRKILQNNTSETSLEITFIPIPTVKLTQKISSSSLLGLLNIGKRPFLKSIEVVGSRYTNIYSLGDRLQFLIEKVNE